MSRKGFIAAMEDIDELNADGTDAQVEVPAEVEAESAAVQEESDDIDDEVQALEDATEAADELEAMTDVAERAEEEGEGLDPVAAEVTEVAVESIYARLGIERKAVPSMESFGSANTRKQATRIAIEDWKESLKKFWEAVKSFFKNLYEKIKSFISRIINFFMSIEKVAKRMKTRVEALPAEHTAKEAEFENKAVKKGFGHAGEGAAGVLAVLAGQQGMTNRLTDVARSISQTLLTGNGPTVSDEKFTNADLKDIASDKYKLFNNTTVKVEEKDGTVEVKVDEDKNGGEGKVKTLSKEDMLKICTTAERYGKDVAIAKKLIEEQDKITKAVTKAADNMIRLTAKEMEKGDDKSATDTAKKAGKSIVSAGKSLTKVENVVLSLNAKAGKAALNYVAASLAQYGEKKKDEKK